MTWENLPRLPTCLHCNPSCASTRVEAHSLPPSEIRKFPINCRGLQWQQETPRGLPMVLQPLTLDMTRQGWAPCSVPGSRSQAFSPH